MLLAFDVFDVLHGVKRKWFAWFACVHVGDLLDLLLALLDFSVLQFYQLTQVFKPVFVRRSAEHWREGVVHGFICMSLFTVEVARSTDIELMELLRVKLLQFEYLRVMSR